MTVTLLIKKTKKNMNNQTIVPVGKRVLILEKTPGDYFPGTRIMIPETAKEKTYQGYVIGVGQEVTEVKVGDLVQYVDYATPVEMKHEGKKHLLIAQGDILAIIHE